MDYNKYCYEIAEVVLILMEKRSIRVENKFFNRGRWKRIAFDKNKNFTGWSGNIDRLIG